MAKKKDNNNFFIDDSDIFMDTSRMSQNNDLNTNNNDNNNFDDENTDLLNEPKIIEREVSKEVVNNRLNSLSSFNQNNSQNNSDKSLKDNNLFDDDFAKEMLNDKVDMNFLNEGFEVLDEQDIVKPNIPQMPQNNDFKADNSNADNLSDIGETPLNQKKKGSLFDDSLKPMDTDENLKGMMLKHGFNSKQNNLNKQPNKKIKEQPKQTFNENSRNHINEQIEIDDDAFDSSLDIDYEDEIINEHNREDLNILKTNTEMTFVDNKAPVKHLTKQEREIDEINKLIEAQQKKKEELKNKKEEYINPADLIVDKSQNKLTDEDYEEMKKAAERSYRNSQRHSNPTPPMRTKDILRDTSIRNENIILENSHGNIGNMIDENIDLSFGDENGDYISKPKSSTMKRNTHKNVVDKPKTQQRVLEKNKVFEQEIEDGMPKFDKELTPLRNLPERNSTFDDYMREQNEQKSIPSWITILALILIIGIVSVVIFFALSS